MWHLLMAHQQESFHPFSSRQSLFCFLSHMVKGSTPKPHGPESHQNHGISTVPKPRGSPPNMATTPGFKPQHQSSSAAPVPTPPTVSFTCQYSRILPASLGYHSKSGQVWPHGMEPIFSKPSHRCCNRGSCLPVTSWVEVTPISLVESMAIAI